MLGLFRAMKFGLAILAAAVMLAGAPSPSHAATGSVRITITRVGFIVGASIGSGTLHFKGKRYPLSIVGASVGRITRVDLVGRAYHLRTAASIHGVYSSVGAGVAGGAKATRLKNSNGVVLEFRGRQVRREAAVDLSGMQVSLR